MALEHVLLTSLREKPAAGLELARRFDKSFGFFWSATHQQIYRVLHRMADAGWVTAVESPDRRDKTVYSLTKAGEAELAQWISTPTPLETARMEIAVKMRAASYGDREALALELKHRLVEHEARLAHYRHLEAAYPDPTALSGLELDQYLVLRGGLRMEQFWIEWLNEYLQAHS